MWQVAGQRFSLPEVWFVFHQTKYVFADAGGKQGFVRLEYPSEGSFQAYLGCRGLKGQAALAVAAERWGPNVLDIPMPSFMKLFAEHAVAPFFVFQVRERRKRRRFLLFLQGNERTARCLAAPPSCSLPSGCLRFVYPCCSFFRLAPALKKRTMHPLSACSPKLTHGARY